MYRTEWNRLLRLSIASIFTQVIFLTYTYSTIELAPIPYTIQNKPCNLTDPNNQWVDDDGELTCPGEREKGWLFHYKDLGPTHAVLLCCEGLDFEPFMNRSFGVNCRRDFDGDEEDLCTKDEGRKECCKDTLEGQIALALHTYENYKSRSRRWHMAVYKVLIMTPVICFFITLYIFIHSVPIEPDPMDEDEVILVNRRLHLNIEERRAYHRYRRRRPNARLENFWVQYMYRKRRAPGR